MHKTVMTVSSAICSGLLGLALCGALQVPAEAQTQRPATPAERTSTAPSRAEVGAPGQWTTPSGRFRT